MIVWEKPIVDLDRLFKVKEKVETLKRAIVNSNTELSEIEVELKQLLKGEF